jgi:hypothetical protein
MTNGTRSGWEVSVTPRRFFTPGKDPVPIVQETGWSPVANLDRCGKSRPSLGFDSRTVQPVASRYTDWVTRPTSGLFVAVDLLTTRFSSLSEPVPGTSGFWQTAADPMSELYLLWSELCNRILCDKPMNKYSAFVELNVSLLCSKYTTTDRYRESSSDKLRLFTAVFVQMSCCGMYRAVW